MIQKPEAQNPEPRTQTRAFVHSHFA